MSALCVSAGGALIKFVGRAFTLAWVHSIEKLPIEEDWILEGSRLKLVESRIKGSGAGIEPGEGAELVDGWLRWAPDQPYREHLTLRRSGQAGTGDWTLCIQSDCRPRSP
jgi:hypothetical protein